MSQCLILQCLMLPGLTLSLFRVIVSVVTVPSFATVSNVTVFDSDVVTVLDVVKASNV